MKRSLLLYLSLYICCTGSHALAERIRRDPPYPPPEWVGDWMTINEQFQKWEIAEFTYKGEAADGGSRGFRFKTSDGSRFDVMVVCSTWWTKEDRERKRQPIFLWVGGKTFPVPEGDEKETKLLKMLNDAAATLKGEGLSDPAYVARLKEIVKSRAIPDDKWPYDRLEIEDKVGDWSKISDRFNKWEIARFMGWGTLTDYSKIFRFETSDDSKIGIFIQVPPPREPVPVADPFEDDVRELEPQKIYLHFEKKLYLVPTSSNAETNLITMLSVAANLEGEGASHPKFIERLQVVVKSRTTPNLMNWPLTDEEFDAQLKSIQ